MQKIHDGQNIKILNQDRLVITDMSSLLFKAPIWLRMALFLLI